VNLHLGEGDTPLISLPRLAQQWGLGALYAKAEHLNPTGSYKDRIAAATMAEALRRGRRGWLGTSSGNGGAAMSAYGRRAGIPGVLCVSADAPPEKLASIRPYGIVMVAMQRMGPAVMAELGRIADAENLQLTITTHVHNPVGMRGARAIGTEIAAQAPDVTQVYVPSGGGGLLVATAGGLLDAGNTAAVVVCQPAGCAPIARYVAGELATPEVDRCDTAVSGLQLPVPPDGPAAADAVRASGGWGAAVSDEDTWRVQDQLAAQEGVFVEPASAVALASVAADAASGRLGPDDRPCVVLSGSGLKDLRRFSGPLRPQDVIAADRLAETVRSGLRDAGTVPVPEGAGA
jgi:threonine synthase